MENDLDVFCGWGLISKIILFNLLSINTKNVKKWEPKTSAANSTPFFISNILCICSIPCN